MEELKPCPFCGKEVELITYPAREWGWNPHKTALHSIGCCNSRCTIRPETKTRSKKRYVIDAWNNRFSQIKQRGMTNGEDRNDSRGGSLRFKEALNE